MRPHSELRQDIAQLLWVGFEGAVLPAHLRRTVASDGVGAVVLFGRNLATADRAGAAPADGPAPLDVAALCALTEGLHAAADRTPLFIAIDQEGGRVQRIGPPATRWPPMLCFDRLGDEEAQELARSIGEAMGIELAALGIDVDFAPVLDVHTNPANPIIGDRAFATEPGRAARRALAFAGGLARAGLVACGKHFPGHGDTQTDSHLELPRVPHDGARIRAVELAPFARAAQANLPMIMTAHVVFPAIDENTPATLSHRAITGVLRGELGFRGLVVSDDLDMRAIADHVAPGDAAVAAVEAGCDALLLCRDQGAQEAAREALIRQAEGRESFRARARQAAAAVRALKRSHTRRAPRRGLDPSAALAALGRSGHRELADRLAGAALGAA